MKFAFEFKIDELNIGGGITNVKNNHAVVTIEDPDEFCPYVKLFLGDKDKDIAETKFRTLNVGIVICTEYAPLNQHHPFIVFRRNTDYSDNYFIRFTLYTEDSCAMNDELANFLNFMYEVKEYFHDGYLLENEVDLNDPAYKYIKDRKVPFNSSMNDINQAMDNLGEIHSEKLPTAKYIDPKVPSMSLNDLAEIMSRPMFTRKEIADMIIKSRENDPCYSWTDDFWED